MTSLKWGISILLAVSVSRSCTAGTSLRLTRFNIAPRSRLTAVSECFWVGAALAVLLGLLLDINGLVG